MNLHVRHSVKFPLKVGSSWSSAQSKLSLRLFHVNTSGCSSVGVWKEKKLFTPGPLLCSPTVKAALNYDLGSRDTQFIQILQSVRQSLVQVAGLSEDEFTGVLMQGSGTFAVESVLQTTSDRSKNKKVLVLVSGAYGRRMVDMCGKARIPCQMVQFPENEAVSISELRRVLDSAPKEEFASVAVVHCETTSGVRNPVSEIGQVLKAEYPGLLYIVDAMSSFGGIEENYSDVDFLISSANKCLQGVPGFGFVIARKVQLERCQGRSTSLSLDLYDQWKGLESSGQFRFTPPTHTILGLRQALQELQEEGGVPARARRYAENNRIIKEGMGALGFCQFVQNECDGHIITSFKYPKDENFNFPEFYNRLSEKGQLIYPGKVTNADCFRIGNIGHLFASDMVHLLSCIKDVLTDMRIRVPVDQ